MENKAHHVYIIPLFLLFTSLVAFNSCKKDKTDDPDTPGNGIASAVVKTNGTTMNFKSEKDSAVAIMAHNKAEDNYAFSLVLKDDNTDGIIEITVLPAKNGAGSYSLTGISADHWALAGVLLKGRKSSKADTYNIVYIDHNGDITKSSGTLNITSLTQNRAKGDFNAVLHSYNVDTKAIKELTISGGSFDVPLVRKDFVLQP